MRIGNRASPVRCVPLNDSSFSFSSRRFWYHDQCSFRARVVSGWADHLQVTWYPIPCCKISIPYFRGKYKRPDIDSWTRHSAIPRFLALSLRLGTILILFGSCSLFHIRSAKEKEKKSYRQEGAAFCHVTSITVPAGRDTLHSPAFMNLPWMLVYLAWQPSIRI